MSRLTIIFKALRELGIKQLLLYAWYQLLLRIGYLRWRTPADQRQKTSASVSTHAVIALPR
ncbi:MAG: hypothetical protein U9Q82_10950, partial [Chloroflexota bacterium]|nr:hypothetical protein [Chloroflexota bacterium]